MAIRKTTEKVSVELDKELLRGVAAEMARMKKTAAGKPTKAGAIRALLRRQIQPIATSKSARMAAIKETLKDAQEFRIEAKQLRTEGKSYQARKTFLAAAILELHALQMLEEPKEEDLRSTLIEVVGLLKDATGYRHLPDVPRQRQDFEGPTV